jgi:hypothetical protein
MRRRTKHCSIRYLPQRAEQGALTMAKAKTKKEVAKAEAITKREALKQGTKE